MKTPTPEQVRLLDAVVRVARPLIREHFNADSCIASTRIGMDVLAHFGVAAVEMPLMAFLFNHEAIKLFEAGMTSQEIGEHVRGISVEQEGGAWTLGVGAPGAPTVSGREGWTGHLVATIPDAGVILDLSLDQASRPQKNMLLKPCWFIVEDEAFWVDPKGRTTIINEAGAMMLDRDALGGTTYKASPNWKRKTSTPAPIFRDVTGRIIRAVRADLM